MPKMLTADQVAEMLQLDAYTVYRMARLGTIPSIRFGRTVRFDQADLQRYLDANRKGQSGVLTTV